MTNKKTNPPVFSVVTPIGAGRPTTEQVISQRMPIADWVSNPDAWKIDDYIEEISQYLLHTYGIIEPHNRHAIAILAGHIDTYIKCTVQLNNAGLVIDYNDGATIGVNQYFNVRAKVMPVIISLMNELGLTPKSKFTPKSNANNNTLAKILKGPKAT